MRELVVDLHLRHLADGAATPGLVSKRICLSEPSLRRLQPVAGSRSRLAGRNHHERTPRDMGLVEAGANTGVRLIFVPDLQAGSRRTHVRGDLSPRSA